MKLRCSLSISIGIAAVICVVAVDCALRGSARAATNRRTADTHRDTQQRCVRRTSHDFGCRPCSSMSLKVLITRANPFRVATRAGLGWIARSFVAGPGVESR